MQKTGAGFTDGRREVQSRLLSIDPRRQGGVSSSPHAEDSASADLRCVVRCPAAGPQEREIVRSSEPARVDPSPDNATACHITPRCSGGMPIVKRDGLSVLRIGTARLPFVVIIGCQPARVISVWGASRRSEN